jgi:hypothetical protein
MQPTGEIRTYRSEEDDKHARPTAAGCLLTLLCVVVILGGAIPVVMWRDDQGRGLPRRLAIALPVVAGAVCYGIGAVVLRILGISILKTSEDEVGLFDDGKSPPEASVDRWQPITDTAPAQGEVVETISYNSESERHRITLLKRDFFLPAATWLVAWFHPNGSAYEGEHGEPTHWRRLRYEPAAQARGLEQ